MLGNVVRQAQALLGSVVALFAFLASDIERSANLSTGATAGAPVNQAAPTPRRGAAP